MNRFFVEPHTNAAHRAGDRLKRLTDEFDRVAVYEEDDQLELLPLAEAQLDRAGDQPFFSRRANTNRSIALRGQSRSTTSGFRHAKLRKRLET